MFRVMGVHKARPTTPRGPRADYQALHRIADEIAPILEEKLRSSLAAFQGQIDIADVIRALMHMETGGIDAVIPWDQIIDEGDIRDELLAAVERAGVASQGQLLGALIAATRIPAAQLTFNARDPAVENWAATRSGDLIREVTDESRQAVRNAIAGALRSGQSYSTSAQNIKDAVGLTRRQAGAVARYRDALIQRGLPSGHVEKMAAAYNERMLKRRAETISRTETIRAVNQGQQEYWNQLADSGAVDPSKAKKIWTVTPDDRLCPLCEPLGGMAVPMGEAFPTQLGLVGSPPLHPNCRCAVSLDTGDD